MRIYFTASMSGKKLFSKNYQAIVDTLKKLNCKVVSEHIIKRNTDDITSESLEQREIHYKKVRKWISDADVVVSEVSHPSTNVGYEISMALDREKPVLALYVKDRAPVLLIGIHSDKLALVSYDLSDLKQVLRSNIEDLKDQVDVRFNFFISPKIGAYLDWIAKHRKIPRAVFLRRLIEEHMKKNKDYKA